MRNTILYIVMFFVAATSYAQQTLWAVGTAVPEGKRALSARPDGRYLLTGTLKKGKLYFCETGNISSPGQFCAPVMPDASLLTDGTPYKATTNAKEAVWAVAIDADNYKLVIDPRKSSLSGCLCVDWVEMYIVGGCTAPGQGKWEMSCIIPFHPVDGQPYVWQCECMLNKDYLNTEPDRFKIIGQRGWTPKHLHPYAMDEQTAETHPFYMGGIDHKWAITQSGNYRITVNLLHETIKVELLSQN
ncbi:MAG: SusF/SusE family outer membrane protein [Bacteroidaceae bacterium]|nr:SusF/SusE family outer membrane protein [Bacteroidaceae bacterium]